MTVIISGTDGVSDVDGTAGTPAIRGTDANTGIFFGADIIGFSEGGAECARFNADAQFVAAAGTALLPVITTTGDVNTGIFFPAADTIAFAEGGAEAVRINSNGFVGIGTTSPNRPLTVKADDGYIQMLNASTGTAIGDGSFIGVEGGTTALRIVNQENDAMSFHTNGLANERMRIASNGIVTMNVYGAGTATFSAAGVISSVSDETWKTKDGVPVNPNAMLQMLEPGYWYYNEEKAPTFGSDRQLGFYAQNVNAAIGSEAAPFPEEGKPWGYYDRSVLAVAVMSLKNALNLIQELSAKNDALEARIAALEAQ